MVSQGRRAQMVPYIGSVEFVTWLWIGFALLTLVASQPSFYTQGRHDRRLTYVIPFKSDMKFGRGIRILPRVTKESRMVEVAPKIVEVAEKTVNVAPRAEHFYLGSRYGKRNLNEAEPYDPVVNNDEIRRNDLVNRVNDGNIGVNNDDRFDETILSEGLD